MKLKQHIGMMRTIYKEFSDDSLYTDEFLANLLNAARSSVYEERLKSRKILSRFNYSSFCVKLYKESFFDCDCLPDSVQCKVLKSEIDIPKVILDNKKDLLKVYLINGTEIPYKHYADRKRYSGNKILSNKLTFDIINNRLVIFGDLLKKIVIVEGLFQNPFDLEEIKNCDIDGNETVNCYNPLEDEYPLETQYEIPCYTLVRSLVFPNLNEDLSENAQNNINRPV